MLMICENNSYRCTLKEVDIYTNSQFNLEKQNIGIFWKKHTSQVPMKGQKNVCNTLNNQDLTYENENKSKLI